MVTNFVGNVRQKRHFQSLQLQTDENLKAGNVSFLIKFTLLDYFWSFYLYQRPNWLLQYHSAADNLVNWLRNVAISCSSTYKIYLQRMELLLHFRHLLQFAVAPLGPVHFLLPDQQSGIHCLIVCAIQLLTPNNSGRTC